MTSRILALLLVATLGACSHMNHGPATHTMGASTPTGAQAPTRLQSRMCQTFRSYEDRSAGGELMEACTRQLGAEMCNRCLTQGL